MKSYVMSVLDEETPGQKGLYGLHVEVDGVPQDSGVVRSGLTDALYWIKVMEGQP